MITTRILVTALLLLFGPGAIASPITFGTNEWQSLRAFSSAGGVSWDALATACSTTTGACAGELNGVDLDGWTWASADDVNDLFNSYLPGTNPNGTPSWTDMGPGPDAATTAVSFWANRWGQSGFARSHIIQTSFPFFMRLADLWTGWLRDRPGALSIVVSSFAPYPGVPPSLISTGQGWTPSSSVYPGDPTFSTAFPLGAYLYRPLPSAVSIPGSALLLGPALVLLSRLRGAGRERLPR